MRRAASEIISVLGAALSARKPNRLCTEDAFRRWHARPLREGRHAGCLDYAQERVAEEARACPMTLLGWHPQRGGQGWRPGAENAARALADLGRRFVMIELPGKECVAAMNSLVIGRGDEGPYRVSTLVLTRAPHQPPAE